MKNKNKQNKISPKAKDNPLFALAQRYARTSKSNGDYVTLAACEQIKAQSAKLYNSFLTETGKYKNIMLSNGSALESNKKFL